MTVISHTILRNGLKDKLAQGEVAASMIVRLVRSIEIAQIAKTAGFDCLYLDNEHNSFSLDTTSQICMAAVTAGIAPLVRVPGSAPEYISRVLDGGALGIIAPHIETAGDAEEVVSAAKFPPFGKRAMTGALPQLQFRSFSTSDTVEIINQATMVVVMIETAEALAQVDDIAAVPGVDVLLIGTNDLCASLGIAGQHEHALVRSAFERVINACRRHNKYAGAGGLANHPNLLQEFVKLGVRYISAGNDLSLLLNAGKAKAKQIHDLPLS